MTKLYFHAIDSRVSGTLPTATKSATVSDADADPQTKNRFMDPTPGTAQTSIVLSTLANITSNDYFITKFVSPPLKTATNISANTWNYAFACAENNANANFPNGGSNLSVPTVAYVWRPSNGTKVGNIIDVVNSGTTYSEPAAINTETSEFGTFTGAAVSGVQAGDVIVFEVWARTTQGNATSRNDTFYFDGPTETNNTGTTVSNHASYIETPQSLVFAAEKYPIESIAFADSVNVYNTPQAAATNVSVKKGTITLDATSGVHDQAFTGVGFQPKAIIFFGVPTTTETYGEGYAQFFGFTDGTTSASVGVASQDNIAQGSAVALASHMMRNDACIELVNPAGTPAEVVRGQLKTFDSDGFTITWNVKNTTQYILHYIAIGGSSITNAKVVHTTTGTTATGNQAHTGVGFKPDALVFLAPYDTTVANTLSDHAALNVGASSGPNRSFGLRTMAIKGFATGSSAKNCWSGLSASEVLYTCHYTANATATDKTRATLVSLDSDGFTLNHVIAPGATTIPFAYLAIKGGYWECGTISQKNSTGTNTTTFPKQLDPSMLLLLGNNSATLETLASNANSVQNRTFIGACDGSLNQGAISTDVPDSSTTVTSTTAMISLTSAVARFVNPAATATSSTTDAEAGISDMSTLGQFTLNWTTANATLRKMGFLTLGTAAGIGGGLTRITNADTLKYNLLKQVKQPQTLKYNVIGRTLHSNTLKYNVLKQVKQSDTLKYNLLKQITHSNTLKYHILKQILHANNLKYNIVGRILHANTLRYNLLKQIKQSNTLKYNLIGRILHSNTLKYNVLKQVKQSNTLKYNLLKQVLKNATLKWNLLAQLSRIVHQNTLKYNIIQRQTHSNILKYNVFKQVTHSDTLKYNLLKQILHANTLKYNIIGRILHANTLRYNVLKQIKHSNTLKYNILQQIKHSNTLRYNILKQVLKNATLKWNLLAQLSRIVHANTLKYNLVGRVLHSNTLKYNLLKQVKNSNTLRYNVIGRVLHANILRYNVIGRVLHSNTLKYNVIGRVLKADTLRYDLLKQVKQSNTLRYNLLKQIKHPITLTWNIVATLNRIIHSNTLKYNLIGRITHQNTLKYNLLKQIKQSNTLKYNLLKQIKHSNILRWNLLQTINHQFTLRYNILAQIKHSNTLKYNLLKQVKQFRTVKYNILKQTTQSATLKYNIINPFTRVKHAFTLRWRLLFNQQQEKGGGYIFPQTKLKQILYPVYSPEAMRRIERRRQLRLFQPLVVIPAFRYNINTVVAPFVITDPVRQTTETKFVIAPTTRDEYHNVIQQDQHHVLRFSGKPIPVSLVPQSTEKIRLNKARCASFVMNQKAIERYRSRLNKFTKILKVLRQAEKLFSSHT